MTSAQTYNKRWPVVLELGLQPALLVAALACWYTQQDNPLTWVMIVIAVQLILGCLEAWRPAREEWRQLTPEKLRNLSIATVIYFGTGVVALIYDTHLAPLLTSLRGVLGIDIWPHGWPLLVQVLLLFFLVELVWYWVHRAEHRFSAIWRVSGHGAHHSFKHLGAINFAANHPLELFWIAFPSALVGMLLGVGAATGGAVVLATVQASIAHSNLTLNTRGIGLLFTTNEYHIRHHSQILEQSNTNYGCSAILWDRLFGTFASGPTEETGTGPTEPSTWQKLWMPIREPMDTSIAP